MKLGKIALIAAVLTVAPLGATAASAQDRHHEDADQHHDTNGNRYSGDRHSDRDRNGSNHWRRDHDRGHHYGWRRGRGNWHRHCYWTWHHHRHIRVCR